MQVNRKILSIEVFMIFMIFCIIGCQSKAKNEVDTQTEEEKYFEDYDIPTNKKGFLDLGGKVVIPAVYDDIRPFRNNLAAVCLKGRWGMIDKDNRFQIEATYRALDDVVNGYTRAQNFDRKYGFIDHRGNTLLPFIYDEIYGFQDGRARFRQGTGWNYINLMGDTLLDIPVIAAQDFNNGNAIVKRNGKYGLVDTSGMTRVTFEYDGLVQLDDGNIMTSKSGKYGIIRNNGVEILPTIYDQIDFGAGHYLIKRDKGYQLMDQKGQNRSTVMVGYDLVKIISDELLAVRKNGKYAMMTYDGEVISDYIYDSLSRLKEGFGIYGKYDSWGYFDKSGKERTPEQYFLAWEFQEGHARVMSDKGYEIIDTRFATLIRSRNAEFMDCRDSLIGFTERQ